MCKPLILNGARQVGKTYIVQESFVKSLRTFIGKHPTLKGLRLSMKSFQDQGWMENRPLYAVGAWL